MNRVKISAVFCSFLLSTNLLLCKAAPIESIEQNTETTKITSGFLKGKVFIDSNGNGVQEVGEKSLPRSTVIFQGLIVRTNYKGNFTVESVPAGEYQITVSPKSLLPNFVPSQESYTVQVQERKSTEVNLAVLPKSTLSKSKSQSKTLTLNKELFYKNEADGPVLAAANTKPNTNAIVLEKQEAQKELEESPIIKEITKSADDLIKEDLDTRNAILTGEIFKRLYNTSEVVDLSLKDAIEYAIQNNLEAQIKKDGREIASLSHKIARGVYAPIIGTETYYQNQIVPFANAVSGANIGQINTESWVINPYLRGESPFGTKYRIDFTNNRIHTNNVFQLLVPEYGTSLGFTVTQPLLRDFWINENLRRIKVLKLNKKIADAEFDAQLQQVVYETEINFWDYILSQKRVEINKQAVYLAEEQLKRTVEMSEVGETAKIEAISVKAELEKRLEELAQAQEKLFRSENDLKLLLSPSSQSDLWVSRINILENLQKNSQNLPSLEEAIMNGLEKRPEFAQIAQNIKIKNLERTFLVNQGLPQADLVAQYTMLGLGGTQRAPVGFVPNANSSVVLPRFNGDYATSLNNLGTNDFRTIKVGMNFSWPVAPATTQKTLRKNQLEKHQFELLLEQTKQQVQAEILNAYNAIQVAEQRIQAAESSYRAASKQLDCENQKFKLGLSTNFLVLTRQNELYEASLRLATATADYNKAITELYKASGVILEQRQVSKL